MKRAGRWAFFGVCMVLRAVLIVIGWVFPVHIMYETPRTKNLSLWERYVENSWRNPTPYLRGYFKQPIPETRPNPDQKVRSGQQFRSVRLMEHGPYIEYWMLKRVPNKNYWEFRIGWKFVDGEETFWPTIQLGPRK